MRDHGEDLHHQHDEGLHARHDGDLRDRDLHDEVRRDGDPHVTLHEERLLVETRPVETGRVRVHKRVITEERTITVRREELVVEEVPVSAADRAASTTGNPAKDAALQAAQPHRPARGDEPVIEMVLHEEQVVTRVVPVEQVRVYVDQVVRERVVEADLASEHAVVEQVEGEPGTVGRHRTR